MFKWFDSHIKKEKKYYGIIFRFVCSQQAMKRRGKNVTIIKFDIKKAKKRNDFSFYIFVVAFIVYALSLSSFLFVSCFISFRLVMFLPFPFHSMSFMDHFTFFSVGNSIFSSFVCYLYRDYFIFFVLLISRFVSPHFFFLC